MLRRLPEVDALDAYGPDELLAFRDAERRGANLLVDRIFIARDIYHLNLYERWEEMRKKFNETRDTKALANEVGDIRVALLIEAQKLTE
jgi:hypothetical protein